MTSFSEGNINRDADGKFAAKVTAETDSSAIGEPTLSDRLEARQTKVKAEGIEGNVYLSGTPDEPVAMTMTRVVVPNDIADDDVRAYAMQWEGASIDPAKRTARFEAYLQSDSTLDDAATALRANGYDDIERMKRDGSLAADMRSFAAERASARETFSNSKTTSPVALMNQYTPYHASDRANADPQAWLAGRHGEAGDETHPSYAAGRRELEFQNRLRAPYPATDPWAS